MFYRLIEKKRDEWLNSPDCTVSNIISYIMQQNKMRDAQIESIKTFLFLKIACKNRPLWELFASGFFNSTDIDNLALRKETRDVLVSNKAALALWEYASISDEKGNINSQQIIDEIQQNPNGIDYINALRNIFYNVDYTDYLFSIPMGAGKTYLMAALIYINLYFAISEPDNPIFAHNFIIFVPSGKKSSIIPSLRDIQNFNPLWILPDPVASQLKNIIHYEWLQEASSSSKSNIVKNPNAQKISMYASNPDLMGLVAVTNAEKVILDRIDVSIENETLYQQLSESEQQEWIAVNKANELRTQIGKIAGLCILIDEVHHASEDQKLRQVVNKWMEQHNFNSVLGFSGTPHMDPPLRVPINDHLTVRCSQYANVVTYYPLINGLGNFLKIPTVRYANIDSNEILEKGLNEFFEQYRNKIYSNGTTAKVAVYAPSIAVLEEELYPEACRICTLMGLNPSDTILKYHQGNHDYKVSEDAQFEFNTLDSPLSQKRIILLVGIGREGWNCRSLTGVILSQRNSCAQNMVLQTCCRCLREVDDAKHETALIWLNKFNADKLNKQLQDQQYTTISTFSGQRVNNLPKLKLYSRIKTLRLPQIDYYQVNIKYDITDEIIVPDIHEYLINYQAPVLDSTIIYTQSFEIEDRVSECAADYGKYTTANFRLWLDFIVKESFGTLPIASLRKYEAELAMLFSHITERHSERIVFKKEIDQLRVRTDIRNCFSKKRSFSVRKEAIGPVKAKFLKKEFSEETIDELPNAIYMPDQQKVEKIITSDKYSEKSISKEQMDAINLLRAGGYNVSVFEREAIYDRIYHYLPYHLDSKLEKNYLSGIIQHVTNIDGVEIYFNGDDNMSDFFIRCYEQRNNIWKFLGNYYPDFIILTRTDDNKIDKLLIVETKGSGFAANFKSRKEFVENDFLKLNKEKFGRKRFDFLYLEEGKYTEEQMISETYNKIRTFLLNQTSNGN